MKYLWVYVNVVGRIEFKLGKAKCDTWTLIGKIPLELDK